jgi:hypothetical protein
MTSDEFTSALATAYNVHLSEVKGLQQEVQTQCVVNRQQEEMIKRLKCNIQRLKQLVKYAKAKVLKEVSLRRKLEEELKRYNIPLPFKLKDASSDEDEDCIPTNLSSSPNTVTPVHLLTKSSASINNPHTVVEYTKLPPTTTTDGVEAKCISGSPTFSAVAHPSICNEGDEETTVLANDEKLCHADTQVRCMPALKLHSLKKLSRNKYRDVSKEEVGSVEKSITSVCDISQNEPVLPQHRKRKSSTPSPSILNASRSPWHLQHSSHNPQIGRQPSERQRTSNIPESDSQLSMNVSQRIPDSMQLPAVRLSLNSLERKRVTLADNLHHSCPGMKQSPLGISQTGIAFEGIRNCLVKQSMAVFLPKTPGIKAASTAVPADKSYFNAVAEYQHHTFRCNGKTLLLDPETTAPRIHHPDFTNAVDCAVSDSTSKDDMKLESYGLGDNSEFTEFNV